MCACLHLRLLGEFALSLDDVQVRALDSARLQSLLAYLLLHRDAPQSRRHLAFLFWPESTEAQALSNLRKVLTGLRKALPDAEQRVSFERNTVQWRSNTALPFTLDVDDLEAALTAARAEPEATEPLQRAVDLYAGDLLPSCYDEWILTPRERLREEFLGALDTLITLLDRSGDSARAVLYSRRLLRHEPLLEENYRRLMRLYMARGDRAGAFNVYKQCTLMLKREYGIEPGEATLAIANQAGTQEAIRGEAAASPAATLASRLLPSAANPTIPAQTTAFFGRDSELVEISAVLGAEKTRLVTLTGTPGTGKTRLGVQVAASLAAAFPDGITFVPLAPVAEPGEGRVLQAIASALEITGAGTTDMRAAVKQYLARKQALLVLDNFEHLLPAAPVVGDLLASCPRLKVLTTSRAPLNLRGEHELAVPPLPMPPADVPARLEDLVQYESVALFIDRALEVFPRLELTPANLRAIADICRRLEGLPLSIELAAARVKALSPPAILARLERRLKLLVGGRRDVPSRHQTLNAAITWSYNLLDDEEKSLFRALGVFSGGVSPDAGAAVGEMSAAKCLDTLISLLDKSLLVRVEGAEGEPRFDMLETLKEYAWERIGEAGEAAGAPRRHAMYFLELAERAAPGLKGAEQGRWLTRLDLEHDNLRAALRWAISHGLASTTLRLVGALARFWELRGYFNEAFSSIQDALVVAPAGEGTRQVPGLRALALSAGGLIAERQGKYSTARGMLTEALELYRVEEDRVGVANALNNLALLEAYEDYDRAIELHMQSLELRRELGDLHGVGASLVNLSYISLHRREHVQARAFAEEALEIVRKLENHWAAAHALYLLAMVSLDAGDTASAVALFEESIAMCREHDYRWPLARVLLGLGQALYVRGEYERSRDQYAESETIYSELGDRQGYAMASVFLGRAAHRLGDMDAASRLYQRALEIGIELQGIIVYGCSFGGLAGILGARGRLNEAARLFAFAEKALAPSGWDLERYAITLGIDETRAALDAATPGAWEASWAEGEAMPLGEAVALARSV